MEGVKSVQTRSASALGEYPPLNNQRQPLTGESVRVRLPADRIHQNIHSHGWIVVKVEFSYATRPIAEEGEDYIIKGSTFVSGKIVLICLAMRGNEDDLDSRAKQGWDIADMDEDPVTGVKHNARMQHSQHPDNKAITQKVITDEEYQRYAINALNTNPSSPGGNVYETPRPVHKHDDNPQSVRARLTPRRPTPIPDKETHHLSSSEVTRPEPSAPSISSTSSSRPEIAMGNWNFSDNKSNKMLGRFFEDNLAAITSKNPDLLDNVDALPEAILTEGKLIQLTNRAGCFLEKETWLKDPIDIKRYTNIRNKWFYLASKYKNQRSDVLYSLETNLSSNMNDPEIDEEVKKLLLELCESGQYNNFVNALKQVDSRMTSLDESVSKMQQDQFESLGSIFEFEDYTQNMDDRTIAKFSDEDISKKRPTPPRTDRENTSRGNDALKTGPTKEHWALRGLGDHDPKHRTSLTVNMMSGQPPLNSSRDQHGVGRVLNTELENMLYQSLLEIAKEMKALNLDIRKSTEEMENVEPSNHTDNILKSYDKKVEKIAESKEKLNDTYRRYIEEYDPSTGMTTIGDHVKNVSSRLSELRDHLQKFSRMARTRVDFEEISYQRQRDARAPELRIDVFKGETSLISYLTWISKNGKLPNNLLNANIRKTLPPIVLERLNLQHPEGSRSSEDVIIFLLKSYGRTGQMESQLREYHVDIGSLNSFFFAGHEESINPNMCKEVITNADLHLVGLRSIFSLREICNIYLGTDETTMWFEENLLTHAYTTWTARGILTCSQINKMSQMKLNCEEKLKWVITKVEDLRDVADRLICSGMAGSLRSTPSANPVLMTNRIDPVPPKVDDAGSRTRPIFPNQERWTSHGGTHPRDRLQQPPTTTWGAPQRPQPGRSTSSSQPGNLNWNPRGPDLPDGRGTTNSPHTRMNRTNNNTTFNAGAGLGGPGGGAPQVVRTTSYPEIYNRFLARIFREAIAHDCAQRTDCADKRTVEYSESWFGDRKWFIMDRIRQHAPSRTGNDFIFDEPKFVNICDAQKRRIVYLLGSPNPCSICTQHLVTSTQLIPLPHFMYSPHTTGHNFRNGKCKTINWPLGCTQILKEDNPGTKIQELQRKNIMDGCPAACAQQFSMSYADGFEPIKMCRENRCQGYNPSETLQRLKGEFQDIVRSNNIDFTTASGKVMILVSIYENCTKKFRGIETWPSQSRQLLYGTQGELFNDLKIKPVRKRKSPFLFIHYNIQSQSGNQSLLRAFQDTCCSSTAIRDEIAGRDITGSAAEEVILEVAGSRRTKEQTLDYLLNYQDQDSSTIRMNNAILVDKIIQDQPLQDTSHQIEKLLKEMKGVCQQHNVEFDIDKENVPRQYGGQLDLLIGNSVFELTKLYTSSFGLSLYQVPLKIDEKRSYAIGGYLFEEEGFEQTPELFTRVFGSINEPITEQPNIIDNVNMEDQFMEAPLGNTNVSENTHTMLVMASKGSDHESTPNEQTSQQAVQDLKLPTFPKEYKLDQILHQLQLFQPTVSAIDTSGSCGYDTIWQQISNTVDNLPPRITDHLNPATRFPIRDLSARLLRLPPEGQPWEDIFELYKATALDDIDKEYIRSPIEKVNELVTNRWRTLADGDVWIDTHVIKLLAIFLEHDIFIFQHQPDNQQKLILHPVTSEQPENMKRPILMLLSSSHYTPLESYTVPEEWYAQCTKGLTPPWRGNTLANMVTTKTTGTIDPLGHSKRDWAKIVKFGIGTTSDTPSDKRNSGSITSGGEDPNDKSNSSMHDENMDTSKESDSMTSTVEIDSSLIHTLEEENPAWITIKKGFKGNKRQSDSLTHNTVNKLQKIRNYWDNLTRGDTTCDNDSSEDERIEKPTTEPISTKKLKVEKGRNRADSMKGGGDMMIGDLMTIGDGDTEDGPATNTKEESPPNVDQRESTNHNETEGITGGGKVNRQSTTLDNDPPHPMPVIPYMRAFTTTSDSDNSKDEDAEKPTIESGRGGPDGPVTHTKEEVPPNRDHREYTNHDENNKIPDDGEVDIQNTASNNGPPYSTPVTPHMTLIVTTGERDKPISDTLLQAKMFDDKLDIKARCATCRDCRLCSPFITIPVKVRENIERNEENIMIRRFMEITDMEDGTKKFVTRMPCEQHIIDEELQGSNRTDVISANDRKLRQLNPDQRRELWDEFQKLVDMGYIQGIEKLPIETRKKLNEAKAQYYIAVAPNFKSTSCSTRTRCAFDASMANKTTKKSLNDILPTGHTGINLCQTFRNFRLHPIGLACDLRKYYNSIEVHEDSYPINRIIFRDNADPSSTLREYVLKNLFYGIKPAGSITDEALKFVAREAVLQCNECIKRAIPDAHKEETETNTTSLREPDKGEVHVQRIDDSVYNPTCPTVNHECYKLLEKKYVDDILASTFTVERVNEIKQFTESKLGEYSFSTKGWNVSGDERTPGSHNLNEDNRLGTCSYLWDPYTDKFKPKEVLLHNGIRFRGALKPMKDWVRTSGDGRLTPVKAPALQTCVFKNISEITTDALDNLWKSTPKTLRSGLSKTYQLFEPCGFLAPLAGQTRAALHEAVKLNGNNMEREIPEHLWQHLMKCIAEMLRAMTFEFDRRPDKEEITEGCKNILITFTDYSLNISIVSYLVTITTTGRPSVIILQARTLNRKLTVPKGELDGLKEGSIQHKTLMTELGDIISEDYILTDSMICIYQLLNDKEHENPFVENRAREIKQNIDVINKVYHVISTENMADLGTRYGTSTSDTNFIACEAVAPHSTYARGRYWFTDLKQAEDVGILTSAKTLHNDKKKKQEESDAQTLTVTTCMLTTSSNDSHSGTEMSNTSTAGEDDLPGLTESEDQYSDNGSDTNQFNSLHDPERVWTEYFLYNSSEFNDQKTYVQESLCNCVCPCADTCNCECLQLENNPNYIDTVKITPDHISKTADHPNPPNINPPICLSPTPIALATQQGEEIFHDALDYAPRETLETRPTASLGTNEDGSSDACKEPIIPYNIPNSTIVEEPRTKYYKCGAVSCGLELKFKSNLMIHCATEHPDVDDAQLEDWFRTNDDDKNKQNPDSETQDDTRQQIDSALLMSITKLHNRRKQEHIGEDVLDQAQTRYWTPGSTDNIKGLLYVNDLRKETFRSFTTNFRITRMVIKACIGFLRLIKKKLSLLHNYHEHFKYLQADSEEQHLTHGTLKDMTFMKEEHTGRIKTCSNFSGAEEDRITNIGARIHTTLKRGNLICLRGTHNNEDLLCEEYGIKEHIETKRTMRQVSYLFNKMNNIINDENENEYAKCWSTIYDILTIHTINMKAKTILADCAVHDITEILAYMVKRGKLAILSRSFEASTRPKHLQWLEGPQTFFINNIVELPRRKTTKKLDVYDSMDYADAMKATATLYGIKISSETTIHAKPTDLKTFATFQDGHWLANKRTSNLAEGKMDPMVEHLLSSAGYGSVSLFHKVFSPTSWAIVKFLHLPDPSDTILQRRTHSHIPQHLGRPKLLGLAEKRYFISKARRVVDIVISMCQQCKLRNQDCEPSPHGRLPLFLLKTNPRPYSCVHIDLAGPVKLLVEKGSRVTRNQRQVSCYILVCVCSLTKHTTLLLLDNTDTNSVSLALSALMKRTGQPSLIIADGQSSFCKIMRENTIVTQNEGVMIINKIPIRLVPAGQLGHSHAGSVEKKIDLLRKLIGNFDFTKTSLPITNFQNLLDIAAGAMNKTPIGIRRACKPVQSIHDSPLIKFMTPESLYDPRSAPSPESFIAIEKDINCYNDASEKMTKFVTDLMFGYLIELQNHGIESYDNFTRLQEGDVVAFKTRDFLHHHYHQPFTSGLVEKVHADPIDRLVRTVDISYMARPGEKVFINEEMTILKTGLYCTTSRPVKTLIKICGKDEMADTFERDAVRTETWLNSYPIQPEVDETGSNGPPCKSHETSQTSQISTIQTQITEGPKTPKNSSWRPDQLICSKPPTECIDKLIAIQEELIERDGEKSQFRVRSEKLHVTHLVISRTEGSKQAFETTNNKILRGNFPTNFILGPIVNYNGNICLELRSRELPAIQNLYKSEFDLRGIRYDDHQSYHITIFKKDHKLNLEPELTCLDEEMFKVDDTNYYLTSIDLCKMERAQNYFPVEASCNISQALSDQQDSQDTEPQDTPPQPPSKPDDLGNKPNPAVNEVMQWHGYNTRQMTRAKNAAMLLCLYYLTQNLALAELGTLKEPQSNSSTFNNITTEEDQSLISQKDQSLIGQTQTSSLHGLWTIPMMTIFLVLWIIVIEIMYSLYTRVRSEVRPANSVKTETGDHSSTTTTDPSQDNEIPPVELNKTTLYTLYEFQPLSKLEDFLVKKTGIKKDCYTLIELLTNLRDIIQNEGMFDASNPEIILCSPGLEEAWDAKALHLSDMRNLVLSHVTRTTNQCFETLPNRLTNMNAIGGSYSPIGNIKLREPLPTPSRIIRSANITKTISTDKNAKFTLAPKLLTVIQSVPGTPPWKTIFTYEDVIHILSRYIHLKKGRIFDTRSIGVALVHDDILGDALNVKAFSRCQINRLVRAQLNPVDETSHADKVVVTNHSSPNLSVTIHNLETTNNTRRGGTNIPGYLSKGGSNIQTAPSLDTNQELPKKSRGRTTGSRPLYNSITIMLTLLLLSVTADNLDDDITELQQSTNHLIAARQQSQQDFERVYKNLAEVQPKVDGKKASNLERLQWVPSQLSTIAILLHQIINAEESARSRMKNDIQRSGIRNMQHIHNSFKTIRRSKKSKRDVTPTQDKTKDRQEHHRDRDSRFIKELKRFFEAYDEAHRPSARVQQFSLKAQNQFDGNLEELRPIQILMGRSDTSDIRAIEDNWMKETAKLPKGELINGLPTKGKASSKVIRTIGDGDSTTTAPETSTTPPVTEVDIQTDSTPEHHSTPPHASGIDDVISLLEELQTLNIMLNPQEVDVEEDQTCKNQRLRKPPQKTTAPPMCAVYAYQANSLLKVIDDCRIKIKELDCHIKVNTEQISNITIQTETLIRNTTEARLLRELKDITNNGNKIDEIISRAQIRAGQVNDGMNILTMKIADRHRTMNVLLEQTDKLIHDTIKAEIRRTMNKKRRDKRSYLGSGYQISEPKRYKRSQTHEPILTTPNKLTAINLANDAGLLPNSVSTGLNTIRTVQDTLNNLANTGNSLYETLSGSGSGQEEEDFLKGIMDEVDAQSKINNEQVTTIKEGDAVDIPCFEDDTGIDTSAVVWMRSDGEFLYNFQLEQKSYKLQISAVNCNDKGRYRCGIKNGEAWDASNIAETWSLHNLKVLCNVERKTSVIPSQVISGEGESATLQCSAPMNTVVQWTKTSGINKQDFSEQGSLIVLQSISSIDAGIYTCSYILQGKPVKEHVILQVHKVPVDGTDPLMRSLGFLEAYDCSQGITKKDSVDLTRVGKCNKDDYMAYETEQPITIELLHHKTTEEVLLNACHLEIELATAYCRPGNYLSLWTGLGWSSPSAGGGNGLDGFATTLKEDFIIPEHVCRSTWRTGTFEINLGRQQVSVAVPQGKPSHTRTSLYLHGSAYGQNFNCSPVYGWHDSGPVYRGQSNQFSEKISHEVVRAVLTLKLQKVFSLADMSKGKLYIPSAGKELDIESMAQEYSTNSPSVGTLVILKGDLPLNKCEQHFHVAGGTANLYAPKGPKANNVPKLIRFETSIQGDKRVFGLQQLGKRDVCGTACHATQFKEIVICVRESSSEYIQQENEDVLNDLGSSSIALFQVNVDKSIQHLMLNLCLLNRKHQLAALRNIERHGPNLISPINHGRGIKVVARGEQAIALECPRTTAIPRSEQHFCCANFPVTLVRPDGSMTDKYLQSISRQITDLCDPVPCSEVLPIQMTTMSGNSICQFKGHIRNCDNPTILQPRDEIGGRLKLLSASEQKLSAVQGALPSQIELWSIISNVRLKAADEMIGRISQQQVKCTGNYCSSDPIDDEFRRNFARSSLPYTMHYFTFSSVLQFFTVLAILLFYYEKITGLLSIIVSIHTCCRDGDTTTRKIPFCAMMLKGFCIFSRACNPLHPRNIEEELKLERMKRKVKKIQSEHKEFISEQASLLQGVSCEATPNNHLVHPEAFNELGNTVRLLWLEVENLQRVIEKIDIQKGARPRTKLKKSTVGRKSRVLQKYPRIFTTPPAKKKISHGVRFDIEDTEF